MVRLTEDHFDLYTYKNTGKTVSVRSFTWETTSKVSAQVITYGATVTFIKIPDKNGIIKDVVAGFKDLTGYQNKNNPYFGATIGRVANRVGFGQYKCGDKIVQVTKNLGKHQIHGGFVGFDKVLWEPYIDGNKLILSYHSADLEEGYPGDLVVHVTFELTEDNKFRIEYDASTTKPTFVNLTNHSYFNLGGHGTGPKELYNHVVSINADRITEKDSEGIPTGTLVPVAGTTFDFRIPRVLGDVINNVPNSNGYDHNYCVNKGSEQGETFIARVVHPDSGRSMEVYSNQPGLQFYTANALPEQPAPGKAKGSVTITGKDGVNYYSHGAMCLETQNWPDAPNHPNFPPWILLPGQTYYQIVSYNFSVQN